MSAAGQLARKIADQGWGGLLPLLPADVTSPVAAVEKGRGKAPGTWDERAGWSLIRDWRNYPNDLDTIERWSSWPGVNVGLRCCHDAAPLIVVIDGDILHHGASDETLESLRRRLSPRGEFLWRVGRAPKFMIPVQVTEPVRKARSVVVEINGQRHMVELLGAGQQFVVAGIHPDTGREYFWPAGGLEDTEPGKLPLVTPAELAEILGECSKILLRHGPAVARRGPIRPEGTKPKPIDELRADDPWLARSAAEFVINNDRPYDDWINWCYALRGAFGDDGEELWRQFSEQSAKNDPATSAGVWRAVTKAEHDGQLRSGAGSIIDTARREGWTGDREAAADGARLAEGLLAGMQAKAESKAPPPEPAPVVGIAYNAALVLQPGGILQQLMDWMVGTSKRPQPHLALGSSVALVGGLAGHRYRLLFNGHDTRTNVLIMGFAGSGAAKDHPRQCGKAILTKIGMADFFTENIASGEGLEGIFESHFVYWLWIDEYGHRIAAALNPHGNPSEKRIVEVITKLFTSAAGTFAHTRRATHRGAAVPITYDPCLVMYTTTVEERFWEAIGPGHLSDGSVARFVFYKSDENYPDLVERVPHFTKRLPEMAELALRVLVDDPGNDLLVTSRIGSMRAVFTDDGRGGSTRQTPLPPDLIDVPIDDDAATELRRLEFEELALLREHEPRGTAALVARLVEHTTHHALICAVSADPKETRLRRHDVLWGEAVAKRSLDTLLRAARLHVAGSEHQRNRNRLLRDVIRVSKRLGWASRGEVTRASQWAKAKERNELLFELVNDGFVERRDATTITGQKTDEFRCDLS